MRDKMTNFLSLRNTFSPFEISACNVIKQCNVLVKVWLAASKAGLDF